MVDMFTGLIETTAGVNRREGRVLNIVKAVELAVGDSVAVNGVCLTVSNLEDESFLVTLSEETSARTALDTLSAGDKVNLERAIPAGGRFGGHFVQGHVDGVAYLLDRDQLKDSVEMLFEFPGDLDRYIVEKGSVAIDGVSLTVATVKADRFTVSVIPHTLETTTLKNKKAGDPVNLEVDILAKYVEKLTNVLIQAPKPAAPGAVEPPAPIRSDALPEILFKPQNHGDQE